MEKKNAAIIGYGGMGSWHGEYLRHSDVVNLMGVYDIKPERCEAAEKNGIHAYSSLKALLSDPAVDFVTIAVPNDMHKPLAIEAMKAGKHVISEKPVTLSSADLQEMFDASDKYHRLFTVHQNRRWDGEFLLMRDIYHSGDLGQVYRMESRVHGSRGIPGDWRGTPEHGGGMILDWGIHLIDQIMMIIPETVTAVDCRFDHITNKEVDDGFKLTMTFASGKEAYVEVGTYNFIAMPRFYMRCKDGTALITDWRENCKVVKCKYWHENDVLPVQTAAGLTKTMAPRDDITTDTYEIAQPHSDVHDFYRNVCKAIAGEETQLVTHAQLRRVMQVIEASFRSAEEKQVVSCDI